MDWHSRYAQQARWTSELREYLFRKAVLSEASRVLDVGCGTGAILSDLTRQSSLHGLDINHAALTQCRTHAPGATLIQGDALHLPYVDESFDIVYCHFLLLWVADPLRALLEMKRVAKPGAHLIAFAEPDYTARVDQPSELVPLGKWQAESLRRQGADPGLGARLADLFFRAGIKVLEAGPIQRAPGDLSVEEWQAEWTVIETDLAGFIPSDDLHRLKALDRQALSRNERVLHVPTYFVFGRA